MLEAEIAGFGASGRNGGWVSGFFSGPAASYDARGPARRRPTPALQRLMFETVDEVATVLERHGIEADLHKGGHLSVALNSAQQSRLETRLPGPGSSDWATRTCACWTASELERRIRVQGALGSELLAARRPHPPGQAPGRPGRDRRAARRGDLRADPGGGDRTARGVTAAGNVSARWVVRATEGYTAGLPGERRSLVPMNSSMIVTEPLGEGAWKEIGWEGARCSATRPTSTSTCSGPPTGGSRSADAGSRTASARGPTAAARPPPRPWRACAAKLNAMFPAAAGRRARPCLVGRARGAAGLVRLDRRRPRSGLAHAGGYVGEGVGAANLAARTLCDLILGEPTELTSLPWVGRRPRSWEPEPLRWASIRGVYSLYRQADRPSGAAGALRSLGRIVDALSGPGLSEYDRPRRASGELDVLPDTAVRDRRGDRDDHPQPSRATQHDRPADARGARGRPSMRRSLKRPSG